MLPDKGDFPIPSLSILASVVEVDIDDLVRISLSKKRARKGERRSNGEFLYNPSHELKIILKRIDQRLLREIRFPETFCSVGGKGQVRHASNHLGKDYLLKMDIKKFFYSVRSRNVKQIFSDLLDCPNDVTDLLTRLTTFEDLVPPGFPTSPRLAPLAFLPVEKGLSRLCADYKVNLSIFADDLAFSANHDFRSELEGKIKFIIKKGGFKIKPDKTIYLVPNQSKEVTGIKIGTKTNVPDRVLNEAKKIIRNFKNGVYFTLPIQGQIEAFASLHGLVNYINQVNPLIGSRLLQQLEEIKPPLKGQPTSAPN